MKHVRANDSLDWVLTDEIPWSHHCALMSLSGAPPPFVFFLIKNTESEFFPVEICHVHER